MTQFGIEPRSPGALANIDHYANGLIYIYIYIYVCMYVYVYLGSISSLMQISLNIIDILCRHKMSIMFNEICIYIYIYIYIYMQISLNIIDILCRHKMSIVFNEICIYIYIYIYIVAILEPFNCVQKRAQARLRILSAKCVYKLYS